MAKQKVNDDLKIEQLFIFDKETKFIFQHQLGSIVVFSESEMNQLLAFHSDDLKAIIILAELDWKGKYVQHFYGFDIAIELRRNHRLLCPIIITSTLKQSYFEQLASNEIRFKILFGRGTIFLPLNELNLKINDALNKLYQFPISEAVLIDMNEMLLNQKGFIIDKITHDLQFGISKIKLAEILNNLSAYLENDKRLLLNWDNFHCQLHSNLLDYTNFNKVKEAFIAKCECELVNNSENTIASPIRKYKIIVLEDDLDFTKRIEENLKEHFEELIITDDAEYAMKLLEKDYNNSITGIITDWRLYKEDSKTYWQIQGYEVLDYAAKNRYIALFSLTSLTDRNINNIRNSLGLDIHLFKKQHLDLDGKAQWDILADTVKQKCDLILEIISSQPTGTGWKKLQPEYLLKRTSGWDTYENEITNEATRIFKYYINAINNDDTRNVYGINEIGIALKNDLKNILTVRRIFFGLYFSLSKTNKYLQNIIPTRLLGDGFFFDTELKNHAVDTHSLIRKDWWDDLSNGLDSTIIEEEWKKMEQRMKNLRATLCIELTELPGKGILPEEKNWLSKNGIDFSFLFNYCLES
jgi:hypothetical protein